MRPAAFHFCCHTVRRLGSQQSGFRNSWNYIYIYTVWTHSGGTYFIYFVCKLPWSQKILTYIMSVFKLNPVLSGTVFSALELKMPSRFRWFGFEIGNRVTNFNFCMLFEVSSLQHPTFNCIVNKTSTEAENWAGGSRDRQTDSCIEAVSKENPAGVWVCSNGNETCIRKLNRWNYSKRLKKGPGDQYVEHFE